jgi:putative redox protein
MIDRLCTFESQKINDMTANILYEGKLRCRCTHIESGTEILTDAPRDNHGNGEAFSPTDLVATALGSCIMTTMAIRCLQMDISIDGTKVEVNKIMASDPRRISQIDVILHMPANNYSDKDKMILERTAMHCPVAISLHPDLVKVVTFVW